MKKKILLIIPAYNEEENILKTYNKVADYNLNNKLIKEAAKMTKSYTGAELEQVAKESIKKAFVNKTKNNLKKINITEQVIKDAIKDVVPISKSSKEKINALETWAQGRAIYANEKEIPNFDNLDDIDMSDFDVM